MRGWGDDGFEAMDSEEGFVGVDFVEQHAVGFPLLAAVLEDDGGVAGIGGVGQEVEGFGFEVDADEGEEAAVFAVAGPDDFVVPVGVVPSQAFDGVFLFEEAEEAGFEPLALEAELVTRFLDAQGCGQVI